MSAYLCLLCVPVRYLIFPNGSGFGIVIRSFEDSGSDSEDRAYESFVI
jgi:hypothetical protein